MDRPGTPIALAGTIMATLYWYILATILFGIVLFTQVMGGCKDGFSLARGLPLTAEAQARAESRSEQQAERPNVFRALVACGAFVSLAIAFVLDRHARGRMPP